MKLKAKDFHSILILVFGLLLVSSVLITYYSVNNLKKRSLSLVNAKLETESINYTRETELSHKAELLKNQANIELLQKIVPKTKDQALAIAELLTIATENSLTIGNMTFPASELGTNSNKSAQSAENIVTQTKPVEGLSGILGIELTISQLNRKGGEPNSGISYLQLINTLKAIERNRRTMQIKNIQIQPIFKFDQVTGYNPTITIILFVKK